MSRQLVGTDYHGNDMIKGGLSATSASEYVSPTPKTSATTRFCLVRVLIVILVVCVCVCLQLLLEMRCHSRLQVLDIR